MRDTVHVAETKCSLRRTAARLCLIHGSSEPTLHFLSRSRSNPSRHAVGQAVPVLYDPASRRSDQDASIDSFSETWLDPIVTGLAAGAFLIGGVGFMIVAWPRLTGPTRQRRGRAPKAH